VLEVDLIETPENVELQRRLAGIGSRFIAGLLDALIVLGGLILLGVILVFTVGLRGLGLGRGSDAGTLVLMFVLVVFFLAYCSYFIFFELITNGQSPGKKVLRIRVVKEGGGPITAADVIIRTLLRAVDGIGLYGVAGVCMFISPKAKRLGDLAAGTLVVSEATSDYSASSDRRTDAQWEREASAEALRATGLTPQEYGILTNYWVRRHELSLEARQRLLPRLAGPVLARLGLEVPDVSVATLEREVALLLHKADQAEEAEGGELP